VILSTIQEWVWFEV